MKARTLGIVLMVFAPLTAAQDEVAEEAGESTLEEITVLGTPEELARTAGSAHRLDTELMELFAHDDINRLLNLVPGVYLRGEDGYGLRPNIGLRGGSSDRSQKVTLLEDGVLFGPAPYSAPAAYFFPMTARMSGVEVFKGPAAIQHGPQTIGGAINLISAPIPGSPAAMLEASGGGEAYRRVHGRLGGSGAGPLSGLGMQAELIHVETDGFKQLDGGGDTGFQRNEAMLKGAHDIGPGTLELRLGYSDELSDETYLGLTESDFRRNPLRRYRASALDQMEWDWNGLRADWQQFVLDGELRVTGYSHRFNRRWTKFNNFADPDTDIRNVLAQPDTPTHSLRYSVLTGEADGNPDFEGDDLLIGTNDRRYLSSGLQSSFNWSVVGGITHEFELGLRLHRDRVRRVHDEYHYEMTAGVPIRSAMPRELTANNEASALASAAWLRDNITIGRLSLAPGLRVEHVESEYADLVNATETRDGYTVVLPGIGAFFAQTPHVGWLAGIHKGFSPAAPGPTPSEPEQALNLEAGTRLQNGFGRIELIGFYSDYSNLTALCTFSSGCSDAAIGEQTNAGRVEVHGAEFSLERDFVFETGHALPLGIGYTYTRGEFREAFSSTNPQFGDVRQGFELPYVPTHRTSLRTGWRAPGWEAQVSLSHESAMRDVAGDGPIPEGSGSDAHTTVDLALRADLWRELDLIGRIDNLADEAHVAARRPFGARPGKPRTFQLGLRWRFGGQ